MNAQMETPAPAVGAGNGGKDEHDGALEFNCNTTRERLLNRICLDGGHTAAFALRCLHQHSPKLAAPILEHFARLADEIDDLELRLLDHMAHEARRAA